MAPALTNFSVSAKKKGGSALSETSRPDGIRRLKSEDKLQAELTRTGLQVEEVLYEIRLASNPPLKQALQTPWLKRRFMANVGDARTQTENQKQLIN